MGIFVGRVSDEALDVASSKAAAAVHLAADPQGGAAFTVSPWGRLTGFKFRCKQVAIAHAAADAVAPVEPDRKCMGCQHVESTAIARSWHDDVINRRNPTVLNEIVAPEVVHHAAGGYPKIMNAE